MPNGTTWTVPALLEHLNRRLAEMDLRYQQRYDASQRALDAALEAADRAVQAALQSADRAVAKAELAADKRFELLNELRVGVATIDQLEALEKVVAAQAAAAATAAGLDAGMVAAAAAAAARAATSRAVSMVAIAAGGFVLTGVSVAVAIYAITK